MWPKLSQMAPFRHLHLYVLNQLTLSANLVRGLSLSVLSKMRPLNGSNIQAVPASIQPGFYVHSEPLFPELTNGFSPRMSKCRDKQKKLFCSPIRSKNCFL